MFVSADFSKCTFDVIIGFIVGKAFCREHVDFMDSKHVPTELRKFLAYCGTDAQKNHRYVCKRY